MSGLRLAKPFLDVAVMTAEPAPMLRFWQERVGLPFEEELPTGGGNLQYRHGLRGGVFKLNHTRGLAPGTPTGLTTLWIADPKRSEAVSWTDPDGNAVVLVPPGERGVEGVAFSITGRDAGALCAFYGEALGLPAAGPSAFRCGNSLLFIEQDDGAPQDVGIAGVGFRYLTLQVFDCRGEHARVLAAGGREGAPPRKHGDVAIFSMVRDPAGHWVEISQRASLTGPLPEA